MEKKSTSILEEVANYYSSKLAQHGDSPLGVDWNGEQSQSLRFKQLCKITTGIENYSVNDLGCGYGALYDFLKHNKCIISYSGFDVSGDMIEAAKNRYRGVSDVRFLTANKPDKTADFGIASGIFNVRLEYSDAEWSHYIKETLDVLNRTSDRGFAFNCLTSYSDKDKMHSYLYYADPCHLFDLCKREYSRDVALLHDYGLYEFTILVRKKL